VFKRQSSYLRALLHQEGTLTFPQMIKLHMSKYFSRYPQFHIKAVGGANPKKDTLSVNANHLHKGKEHKGKAPQGRFQRQDNRFNKGTQRYHYQGNRNSHDKKNKNDQSQKAHHFSTSTPEKQVTTKRNSEACQYRPATIFLMTSTFQNSQPKIGKSDTFGIKIISPL
jgi:hypothetical protein